MSECMLLWEEEKYTSRGMAEKANDLGRQANVENKNKQRWAKVNKVRDAEKEINR